MGRNITDFWIHAEVYYEGERAEAIAALIYTSKHARALQRAR